MYSAGIRTLVAALLVCAWAAHAEEPLAADAAMLEADGLQVSSAFVKKVEAAWIKEQKAADPDFEIEDLPTFRREICEKQLQVLLMERFVKVNKLTADAKIAEKRLEEFKSMLQSQGIAYERYLACMAKSDEEFRRANNDMVALEQHLETVVTEKDVDQFIKDFGRQIAARRCSHILYMYKSGAESPATRTKDEAKKLAEDALAKLKAGGDFEQLARDGSECPSRAVGGDLEWNGQEGQLVKAFSDALYKLEKIGDLSPIVETDYGYHIIKLTGLRTEAELRPQIKAQLVQERLEQFMEQLLEETRTKMKYDDKLLGVPEKKPKPDAKGETKTPEAKTE